MRPDSTDHLAVSRPRLAGRAWRLSGIWLWIFARLIAAANADVPAPVALTPLVVTASRAPQALDRVAFSTRLLTSEELRAAPTATLDGALRAVPGFSLFRRSDSFSANPTAQGVSLRGLGPSGASRSLVLLEGVPLNDPFGGWVPWSQLPRESIASAEIVRGGGATAWGNAALGGVIQLLSPSLTEDHTTLSVSAGAFTTRRAALGFTRNLGPSSVQFFGETFTTAGFNLVAPERRGSIDEPAASNHHAFTLRARTRLGENLTASLTARTFEESRHNGTPYQRNGSRSHFGAVGLSGVVTPVFNWNASAYAQRGSFASTFSSINATRTAETPASDQVGVPSRAEGAAWSGTWLHAAQAQTAFGFDGRTVRGETQENFTFTNGAYTRQRFAGGRQAFAGLWALHEQTLARDYTLTLGARLDDWRESDGHRRESINATGLLARDDHYADQHGIELSPSAGLVWRTTPELRLRAAAQHAFRRPTLNELYRPFRAGSTVTEANPALRTERVTSTEIGADWTRGAFALTGALFWNDLHDAVGNVTVARGPGTFPIVGPLAAGGIGRQRLNLTTTRVRGIEFSTQYRLNERLRFTAEALWNEATVRRAEVAPALEGKRVAQVPRHTLSCGVTARAPGGITLTPRLRWIGAQAEDDENTLRLGEVAVIDLGAVYPLGRGWELFVTGENLGNARIETGRSADGVVNLGTPRLGLAGVRGSW